MERIRTNVDKETGDKIRDLELPGVKVDEDFKRYYPYQELASKVLGFTGGDNQGIVGLEVKYEEYLKGINGRILTITDARGMELEAVAENRVEPIPGHTLQISLDYNIQTYAQQMAEKVMEEKQADQVEILLMNPQNGEILAMVNVPEFNLNEPFTLPAEGELEKENESSKRRTTEQERMTAEEKQDALNQMWRNGCINDTYEPGSTFKIITSSACLEEGVVKLDDRFHCPGYKMVEDRKIRCHKVGGHGSETFVQGIQNSCNPVFIEIGLRLGTDDFYKYFEQFGLMGETGVDLPGEASTIMHKKENVGQVELATMSFGQSFQVTPVQMAATVSSLINGGYYYQPHVVKQVQDENGNVIETNDPTLLRKTVSKQTSDRVKEALRAVMTDGTGVPANVEGYDIGGKTGTAEKLPRGNGDYLLSFIGYAPQENPEVVIYVVIDEPNVENQELSSYVLELSQKIMAEAFPYLNITRNGDALPEDSGVREDVQQDFDESYEDTYSNQDGAYIDPNYQPDYDSWATSPESSETTE